MSKQKKIAPEISVGGVSSITREVEGEFSRRVTSLLWANYWASSRVPIFIDEVEALLYPAERKRPSAAVRRFLKNLRLDSVVNTCPLVIGSLPRWPVRGRSLRVERTMPRHETGKFDRR